MDDWFRGELGEYAKELFEDGNASANLLVKKYRLKDLLSRHRENQVQAGNQLWAMLVLCQWINYWS
jgi:hypothetical protein